MCAGCTAYRDVATATGAFDSTPICCASFSDMKFVALHVGANAVSLDIGDPAFDFGTNGKSLFKAFVLPAASVSAISIESTEFQNGYPSKGPAIFFPSIALLDANKVLVGTIDWIHDGVLRPGDMGGAAYVKAEANLDNFPTAHFIVIYTKSANIDTTHNLKFTAVPVMNGGALGYAMSSLMGGESIVPVLGSPIAPNSLSISVR
jgi:hypothetical protein